MENDYMKKTTLVIIFLMIVSLLNAEEISSIIRFEIPDSLTVISVDEICKIRGHYAVGYGIYKENVLPFTIDYPDSTVIYYYKDNIQTGAILRCKRCGEWLNIQMEKPLKRVLWKAERGK